MFYNLDVTHKKEGKHNYQSISVDIIILIVCQTRRLHTTLCCITTTMLQVVSENITGVISYDQINDIEHALFVMINCVTIFQPAQ